MCIDCDESLEIPAGQEGEPGPVGPECQLTVGLITQSNTSSDANTPIAGVLDTIVCPVTIAVAGDYIFDISANIGCSPFLATTVQIYSIINKNGTDVTSVASYRHEDTQIFHTGYSENRDTRIFNYTHKCKLTGLIVGDIIGFNFKCNQVTSGALVAPYIKNAEMLYIKK